MTWYNKIFLACFGMLVVSCSASSPAQKVASAEKEKEILSLLDQREYVFTANLLIPMGGRSRQITGVYNMVVSSDSINTFLPYFGRSFSAPIDATKIGVEFIATDFDYVMTTRKKDSRQIVITPHDNRDVRHLTLLVGTNGYATLNVVLFNRQPIQYSGYVSSRENNNR